MNWTEYLELSEKTLSQELHIGAKVQNTLHAIMGICTELEELLDNYISDESMDSANILEEIGDVMWYIAILHREYPSMVRLENTTVSVSHETPLNCVLDINKSSLKLLDVMKKKIFYNKNIDRITFDKLVLLVESDVNWLVGHYNLKMEDVCQVNIDKLKARYGDKFTSDKVINRDLDTEREILEKGENS